MNLTPKESIKNADKLARSFTPDTVIVFIVAGLVIVFGSVFGLSTTARALLFAASAAALIGLPARNFGALTAAACLYAAAGAHGGMLMGIICLAMVGVMVGDAVAVSK